MEYYHHSKFSNIEEDDDKQKSQGSYETNTIRSYDCVFCRQGFTSAQALGGHMNIHRKDRANNSKKSKEDNHGSDHRISYLSFNLNHSSYYSSPSETPIAKSNHSKYSSNAKPSRLTLFESGEREELDLELRLGHFP